MKDHGNSLPPSAATVTSDADVLDVEALADLTHIPKATILTMRSRSPDRLPPPFRQRPLRWRMQTVVRWMESQEQTELERIARIRQGTRAHG